MEFKNEIWNTSSVSIPQSSTYMANIWQYVSKIEKMQRTYNKLPNSQEKSKLDVYIPSSLASLYMSFSPMT